MEGFIKREDFIFNTRVIQLVKVREDGETILNKAYNLMKSYEKLLSFYNDESDVSKINKAAGKKYVKVAKDTFEIIKEAVFYGEKTEGLFDITIAPLVKLWSVNINNPRIPADKEIGELLPLVNYNYILLNEENSTVKLIKENTMIDLGGIAKGYIADKIIELYKENNIKSAIINIGGNIKVLGKKSEEQFWNVGILEPKKNSDKNVCSVFLEDLSIVTSGDYERAFLYEGKLYHHIINPQTGYPAESDIKSITIISESSFQADAYSTPLFIMGKYKAAQFMRENKINGIIISKDNEIILSKELINKFNLIKEYKVMAF